MSEDNVILYVKDGIAHVTLNRPEVHNAFDEATIARLTAIWDELAQREDVIAVILRGAGKSFSAGGDLNWMKRAASFTEMQNREDALKLARMLHKLNILPKMTIACVQGAVMGGGMGLVACCDMAIAQRDSMFALSEVKLGLIPATIAPYVLRAIGERQFRRYAQTGEKFTGAEAHAIGLIHALYGTQAEGDEKLAATLDQLSKNGTRAMAASKRLALDLTGKPATHDLINDTADRIAAIRAGAEAKEGIVAFLEKRKAAWVR